MKKNKKLIIYIVVSLLLIALISAGTIFALNMMNTKETTTKPVTAEQTIKNLRDEAEKARLADDKAKAKELLAQAKQKLKEQPKSDANTNASVDVSAQQCLLGVTSACKGY